MFKSILTKIEYLIAYPLSILLFFCASHRITHKRSILYGVIMEDHNYLYRQECTIDMFIIDIINEVNELLRAIDDKFWTNYVLDESKYDCLSTDVYNNGRAVIICNVLGLSIWCLQYRLGGEDIHHETYGDVVSMSEIENNIFRTPLLCYLKWLPYKLQLEFADALINVMYFDEKIVMNVLSEYANIGVRGAHMNASIMLCRLMNRTKRN